MWSQSEDQKEKKKSKRQAQLLTQGSLALLEPHPGAHGGHQRLSRPSTHCLLTEIQTAPAWFQGDQGISNLDTRKLTLYPFFFSFKSQN